MAGMSKIIENDSAGSTRDHTACLSWGAVKESASFLEDEKATDVLVLDIGMQSSFADFFIIASAQSLGHMRGLVKNVDGVLATHNLGPRGTKRGVNDDDNWILLDCGDFIIHIMTGEARAFYDLEKLWFESPRVEFRE